MLHVDLAMCQVLKKYCSKQCKGGNLLEDLWLGPYTTYRHLGKTEEHDSLYVTAAKIGFTNLVLICMEQVPGIK